MKIFFITNFCSHYRKNLFEMLAQKVDLKFLFFSDGTEWYWDQKHPKIHGKFDSESLPGFYLPGHIRIVPGLLSKLMFAKYNLIIKCINGKFALPVSFLIAKLRRKKFILWTGVWMHPRSFLHRLTFPLTWLIYRFSDAIVVYGEHVKAYLVNLGITSKKIFIGWNTVDNSLFNKPVPNSELQQIKNRLGLSNEKIALTTGRLEEVKGLLFLLQAMKVVQEKQPVALIIIGRGALKNDLVKLAVDLGLEKCIFLDYIENTELYKYYALADVFVLSSITTPMFKEPWGLVINEAMNQGCPVVATDAVGAAVGGLVDDGVNGFVVPERNSEKLAEAILKIFQNPQLAESMGKSGREKIEKWDYEHQAQGFVDAIQYCSGNYVH